VTHECLLWVVSEHTGKSMRGETLERFVGDIAAKEIFCLVECDGDAHDVAALRFLARPKQTSRRLTMRFRRARLLYPESADRLALHSNVRLVPKADIAPIANECDACGDVYLPPLRTGRNRGSHCTSRDCLPAQSAGIVQSNYIGSPSTRFLCCSVSRRTRGARRRRPVADKRSA
jgi:hypothetical protein